MVLLRNRLVLFLHYRQYFRPGCSYHSNISPPHPPGSHCTDQWYIVPWNRESNVKSEWCKNCHCSCTIWIFLLCQNWSFTKVSFTNYVDKFLTFFDHLPSCVDIFYGINVDIKWTFLDHLPASSCKRSLWTTPYCKWLPVLFVKNDQNFPQIDHGLLNRGWFSKFATHKWLF